MPMPVCARSASRVPMLRNSTSRMRAACTMKTGVCVIFSELVIAGNMGLEDWSWLGGRGGTSTSMRVPLDAPRSSSSVRATFPRPLRLLSSLFSFSTNITERPSGRRTSTAALASLSPLPSPAEAPVLEDLEEPPSASRCASAASASSASLTSRASSLSCCACVSLCLSSTSSCSLSAASNASCCSCAASGSAVSCNCRCVSCCARSCATLLVCGLASFRAPSPTTCTGALGGTGEGCAGEGVQLLASQSQLG
mmetsp:Transcript_31279/g.68973  ORF Transcript_31279/g.68973 Transcript_31279/m.68973 type:complete len:253 (+) Transcript_31279:879-1637(+)